MDLEALYQKLIAAARIERPAATVPYAFEQRILAHVTTRSPASATVGWESLLWRAAAASVGVALAVSVVGLLSLGDNGTSLASLAYGQDLESTVLAAADVLSDLW